MQVESPSWLQRFDTYKELSKSGIVALVVISVLGGYLTGRPLDQDLGLVRLAATLFGILLLASGSSALNQIQEREIDAQMPLTAKRPLPSGTLQLWEAWTFVGVTGIGGLVILNSLGRPLLWLGFASVISYNGLYTLWWKKHWAFAAVPGAVPGALPILMGYAAADGRVLAPGGLYLFAILFFWQMPHFWVLALRYRKDYAQGGFPTLPVALGSDVTVRQIVIWGLGYVAIALMAPLFIGLHHIYLVLAILTSAKVLWELFAFAREPESKRWLHFFLWVNFSLILYIAAAALDHWSMHLFRRWMI